MMRETWDICRAFGCRYGQKYWEHWKFGVGAFVLFPLLGVVVGVAASWMGA